jgi:hypothetical protein
MPKDMSPEFIDFLYHLAVNRAERKKFYDNPKAYLAKTRARLSAEEKRILLKDALEMKRVSKERKELLARLRKKAFGDIPFESELEKVYGRKMPHFTDKDGFIDDDDDHGKKEQ